MVSRFVRFAIALALFSHIGCEKEIGETPTTQKELGQEGESKKAEVALPFEQSSAGKGIVRPVPFSGTKEQIKTSLEKIPGATPDLTKSDGYGSTLNWIGGEFYGLPVDQWSFGFFRDQMTFGQLHYTTDRTKLSGDVLYSELSNALEESFGTLLFDSNNKVSRALSPFSPVEQEFLSRVGSAMAGSEFRMWSSGDSTIPHLVALYRAPRDESGVIKDAYVTYYDRIQSEEYEKMLRKYTE